MKTQIGIINGTPVTAENVSSPAGKETAIKCGEIKFCVAREDASRTDAILNYISEVINHKPE